MSRFRHSYFSAAIAVVFAASPAQAQVVAPPTSPPGSGGLPIPPAPTCAGTHKTATVNPYAPAAGANHSTIAKALCHVKPGGTVIVYRDRAKAYAESIVVTKPGLTIAAADADLGGMIEIRPPAGSCAVIRPWNPKPNDPAAKATTTLKGFIFGAPAGSELPCIDVQNGVLTLSYSRVDMTESEATAIHVGYTGELDFVGSNYVEHGIFRNRLADPALRRGYGVVSERGPSVALTNVRLEGLEGAFVTRSERNTLRGVRFLNNGVAVHVADDAVAALYAPQLTVVATRFEGNDDGVLLGVGPLGGAESAGDLKLPFRGAVQIAGDDPASAVAFIGNLRGFGFTGAYPEKELTFGSASFSGNIEHALSLTLPEGTTATINNATFAANGVAIQLDGPLGGDLYLTGVTSLSAGANPALTIETGGGIFSAQIASLSGAPALRFGGGFFGTSGGRINVNVASKGKPEMLAIGPSTLFCTADLDDKQMRESFAKRLDGLKVVIDGAQIARHFSKKGGALSASELRDAQKRLCR